MRASRFKHLVDRAIKLASSKDEVHYTALAYWLGINPADAIRVAKAVAEILPDEYEYSRGYLRQKDGGGSGQPDLGRPIRSAEEFDQELARLRAAKPVA